MIMPLPSEVALAPGQKNLFPDPYPQAAGCLRDLYSCVSSEQNFPRQLNAGENQDLYFATQLAFDALADAGMRPHANPPVRGAVFLGYAPPFNSSTVNWLDHTLFVDQTMDILRSFIPAGDPERFDDIRAQLVDSLPVPNAESFLTGTGYHVAVWIARESGFCGPAAVIDSGPVSGAACVRAAMDALRDGRVDVALVGAVTPPLSRALLAGLSGSVNFSSSNRLLPFDRDSDGTLPGEGGAFLVLKRRADALTARDRIYALVRSACEEVPERRDAESVSAALSGAAAAAGIDVKSIGLVEADGNGIAFSDACEIAAVQSLWGVHRPGEPLVGIGSVKGNIGHTLRVSALAGMVKTALSLHHRTLPPQVPPEHPIPALESDESPAYLLTEARPWITGDAASPRRAAVLAGDSDGRVSALLLEEEPEERA